MSEYYAIDVRKWSLERKLEWIDSIGAQGDMFDRVIAYAEILYYEGPGDWAHSDSNYYFRHHTEDYPLQITTEPETASDGIPEEFVINGIVYRRVY